MSIISSHGKKGREYSREGAEWNQRFCFEGFKIIHHRMIVLNLIFFVFSLPAAISN